jgi:hypothetical protein
MNATTATDDGYILGMHEDAIAEDHRGYPDDEWLAEGQANEQQDHPHKEGNDRCQVYIHDMFPFVVMMLLVQPRSGHHPWVRRSNRQPDE